MTAAKRYIDMTGPDGITIYDEHGNTITTRAAGVTILDNFGNIIETESTGFTVTDKNNNNIVTSATGIELTDDNGNIWQMKSGEIELTTALLRLNGSFLFTGTGHVIGDMTWDGNIQLNGEMLATGEITAMNDHTVSQHTHGGVASGSSNTATPTG